LADLYAAAIVALRAGETAAGSPPRLVLFEPGAAWALFGVGAPPDFARDRDVVYAPHLYQGGLDDKPLAPAFATAVEDAKRYGGAPVLSGEWGSDPRRASDPDDVYFREHQRLQDEWRIGATLWTWRESCGDPHKAADVRAGRVPYVWGEFEVDCTSNAVTGVRQDLLDQLTRTFVRAAPGRLTTVVSSSLGVVSAAATEAAAGAELLVFLPQPNDTVITSSGLTDTRLVFRPDSGGYFVARTVGGAWSILLLPATPIPPPASALVAAR
jgi:endoglycosylceramidase